MSTPISKMSKPEFRDLLSRYRARSNFWDLLSDLQIMEWDVWEQYMTIMESELTLVHIKRGEKD